jgi:hypothetical protein
LDRGVSGCASFRDEDVGQPDATLTTLYHVLLEVKWRRPGGGTQRFKDLLIDRHMTSVEGEEKWK